MIYNARPIEVAIARSTSLLRLVLELGAIAEFPWENDSLLLKAFKTEDRMLLLKHGADPNKLIDGIPVFMKIFTKQFDGASLFEKYYFSFNFLLDASEVVYELVKRKCDFNFSHNGETVLDVS